MDSFTIKGGAPWRGSMQVSGAKNVAMKVVLCGLLTDEAIHIANVPLISSVYGTAEIVRHLGVQTTISKQHTMTIQGKRITSSTVPLEQGGLFRTATMVIGPLLCRTGQAIVPNPGGCRLGKRPIDRHIEGLEAMGAKIRYREGFFHATAKGLHGTTYRFPSNTHTGTETLILAAVLAKGQTVLENAAQEPEVDDLIKLLNSMGAQIRRTEPRAIRIDGVSALRGTHYTVMPDRNEAVTFAVGAIASGGNVIVEGAIASDLQAFLDALDAAGGGWEKVSETSIRFFRKSTLKASHIVTRPHPGFMTDWQGPWTLLMTQANGMSHLHETIYENRFCYVDQLCKMGAGITFYNPEVADPKEVYNFQWSAREKRHQAIRIQGSEKLHNALLEVADLRAGATLVLAAAIAHGESVIRGVEHIDRGYERIEKRLRAVGVAIKRVEEIA